ncbi:MAG: hypothetical protein ACK559_03620 [bacterium]
MANRHRERIKPLARYITPAPLHVACCLCSWASKRAAPTASLQQEPT